jgi:hypothetical protein
MCQLMMTEQSRKFEKVQWLTLHVVLLNAV